MTSIKTICFTAFVVSKMVPAGLFGSRATDVIRIAPAAGEPVAMRFSPNCTEGLISLDTGVGKVIRIYASSDEQKFKNRLDPKIEDQRYINQQQLYDLKARNIVASLKVLSGTDLGSFLREERPNNRLTTKQVLQLIKLIDTAVKLPDVDKNYGALRKERAAAAVLRNTQSFLSEYEDFKKIVSNVGAITPKAIKKIDPFDSNVEDTIPDDRKDDRRGRQRARSFGSE